MTLAEAQAAANDLRTALLDNGVRAVSIELQPGVAGSGWGVAPFKRGLGHHIASRPSQGLTPGLAVVKNGRGGANPLTGPLANGYGGYDLVARIITLGWANHPGAGGPWPVPGWGTIPADNGRPYILGWEFEGGYEPYTDEMHDFMARCGAGTLDWLGTLPGNPGPAPLECWDEHKGWAGPRKSDRIGYTTASGRARIAAVRDTKEDEMPLTDADVEKIWSYVIAEREKVGPAPAFAWLQHAAINAGGARTEIAGLDLVDETKLAAELAPLLTARTGALSDADLAAVAIAVADEQARRLTP